MDKLTRCPKCRMVVPLKEGVCPYCKTQLDGSVIICPGCWRENPPYADKCLYCGAKLSESEGKKKTKNKNKKSEKTSSFKEFKGIRVKIRKISAVLKQRARKTGKRQIRKQRRKVFLKLNMIIKKPRIIKKKSIKKPGVGRG